MSDEMARTEELVKKATILGADEALAQTTVGHWRQTRFSNNQVDITVSWRDYVTDLAVVWKKRMVATQIRDFQDVDGSVNRLLRLAKASKENPMFAGFAKGRYHYRDSWADEDVVKVEGSAEYVLEAVEAARRAGGPKTETGGILLARLENVYLFSSEGPAGEDRRSSIELSIRAFSQREASGHGVECGPSLKGFDPSRAGEKAGQIARLARNPSAGVEGRYDVIFDPLIVGSLLATWGSMTSAYEVVTHRSIFVEKLGQRVAPEIVTLRDSPSTYSVANRVFDDEGVPAKENILIRNGVLETYLHNTSTAKTFNVETTGNAGLVAPAPWNVEMDPGDLGRDELFRSVKRGLYLTNTWYTRFQNYATGDFSTIPRDGIFLIEQGEVKRSWKDIRLSDNALRMLNGIVGVSKERQHVHWWAEADPPSLAPCILMKDVQITTPRS